MQNISKSLKTIYIATQRIGKDSSNLSDSSKLIDFILRKLNEDGTDVYSSKLAHYIQKRAKERINSNLTDLCMVLNNETKPENIIRTSEFAEKLFNRLFPNDNEAISVPINVSNEVEDEIEELLANKKPKYNSNSFKNSFSLFLRNGIRDEMIMKLSNAVNSVPPSSIMVERLFSIAGNFCRVRRNRIKSELLNSLLILNKEL